MKDSMFLISTGIIFLGITSLQIYQVYKQKPISSRKRHHTVVLNIYFGIQNCWCVILHYAIIK